MSAHLFYMTQSFHPALWLAEEMTILVLIGCCNDNRGPDWLRNQAGKREAEKKILSTWVHVSFCLTFLVFTDLTLRLENWSYLVAAVKKQNGVFLLEKI